MIALFPAAAHARTVADLADLLEHDPRLEVWEAVWDTIAILVQENAADASISITDAELNAEIAAFNRAIHAELDRRRRLRNDNMPPAGGAA